MRRILVLSITIALFATACGDSGGSLSAAKWCDSAQSIDQASNALDLPTAANLQEFANQIDQVTKSAPAEIRDDVKLMSDFVHTLITAIDDNNGDIALAFESLSATIDDPKYGDAGDRITAYNARECGITDTNSADNSSSPTTAPSTTTPDNSSSPTTAPSTTAAGNSGGSPDPIVPTDAVITAVSNALGVTQDEARCLVSKLGITANQIPDFTKVMAAAGECGIDVGNLGAGG